VVNNIFVGQMHVATALFFFLMAGLMAVVMRAQLALPDSNLVGHGLFNQLFTMHGSMMMFLFATPVVGGMAVYLLPSMMGARDMPFPRLSAYGFWSYFIGGMIFFSSLFFGLAPDGGWFMYPPLTSLEFSPGINADFWLLGIAFIEISVIAAAIEIVVGIFRTRAPGMTLDKLPVYTWAMLVFAAMIIFAFPALVLGTLMLELERAFDWPFFIAERGGDSLLWQHLFWFFGHPEVYIIFIPAAGMVSMIVPVMAQTPLVGYRLVVLALIATGFFSFGLWVHHMFATGMPKVSLSFFSAASMAVAIPSGIQVFAWIATIAAGRLKLTVPTLFILGFLFIFTLGGLTGVMVAMIPFDWQAHDTYFIVAHLHYVLIGGLVFPLFAALYFWAPMASRKPLSETLGRWAFGLIFVGVNVTFFPMHLTGLLGMPRRVYTFPAGLGWDELNLISSLGAVLLTVGVGVIVFDFARNFRSSALNNAGNIWNADTLEWSMGRAYSMRSIPIVASRHPLWDQPELAADVGAGHYYMPAAPTGGRETLITSPIDARPQYVLQLPSADWAPIARRAVHGRILLVPDLQDGRAGPGLRCRSARRVHLVAVADRSRRDARSVDIGGGITVPVYATGTDSHSWWAMVTLLVAIATLFTSLVFSYSLSVDGQSARLAARRGVPSASLAARHCRLCCTWPPAWPWLWRAPRSDVAPGRSGIATPALLGVAVMLLVAAASIEILTHWQSGLRPTAHSYGAIVYLTGSLQGAAVFTATIMGLFTVAKHLSGRLTSVRRVTLDNVTLFWHYAWRKASSGSSWCICWRACHRNRSDEQRPLHPAHRLSACRHDRVGRGLHRRLHGSRHRVRARSRRTWHVRNSHPAVLDRHRHQLVALAATGLMVLIAYRRRPRPARTDPRASSRPWR
jgi:cytochrome c oxidase subunit I+III